MTAGILRISRAALKKSFAYRVNLLTGLFGPILKIVVMRSLWIALYAGQETHDGISLDSMLLYAILSQAIYGLFPNSLIAHINGRIRDGDIIFDIARPYHFHSVLFFQEVGRAAATVVSRVIPLLLFSFLVYGSTVHLEPLVMFAAIVSLALSFVVSFQIDLVFALFAFWFTDAGGLVYFKWSMSDLLGGAYIPLWFFPGIVKTIATWLPFRAVHFVPLAILVGETDVSSVPGELLFQLTWAVVLTAISLGIYHRVVLRLQVQGG